MPTPNKYVQIECLNCGSRLPFNLDLTRLLNHFANALDYAPTQPRRHAVQELFKDLFHSLDYRCTTSPQQSSNPLESVVSKSKNNGRVQCNTCGQYVTINQELAALVAEFLEVHHAADTTQERNAVEAEFADSFFALGYTYFPLPEQS